MYNSKPANGTALEPYRDLLLFLKNQQNAYLLENILNKEESSLHALDDSNIGHILFYGPTGSGKTNALKIILDFLQNKYDQNIYYILKLSAASLRTKWIGGSDEKFNHVVNQWEKHRKPLENRARLILLIDEIDSVGFKRAGVTENQSIKAENDAVNSLLTFIERAGTLNITIVATTNYIQNIDHAVLRAGRLSKKIFIQYPSEQEKKIFIQTSLSHMEEKLRKKYFNVKYDEKENIINIISEASTTYKEISNNIHHITTMIFDLSDNNN
jgi:SpoVK/Ycf46/Vps4 family AAA+-type ATPase